MFTALYVLSPYIKQIRFVFKGLNNTMIAVFEVLAAVLLKIRVFQVLTSRGLVRTFCLRGQTVCTEDLNVQ
jgi:hypothetical protein